MIYYRKSSGHSLGTWLFTAREGEGKRRKKRRDLHLETREPQMEKCYRNSKGQQIGWIQIRNVLNEKAWDSSTLIKGKFKKTTV